MIPKATKEIPPKIYKLIMKIGEEWKQSNKKKLFSPSIVKHWAKLINDWEKDKTMPLIIRKGSDIRGNSISHSKSKREIIITDNSPAHWVAEQIFYRQKPSLNDIKQFIQANLIPVKFAPKKGEENTKYNKRSNYYLNKAGWKLCHIKPVGLKKRGKIEDMEIIVLEEKFNLLMNPNNFYVLPIVMGSLGEIPCFTESLNSNVKNMKKNGKSER